MPSLRSSRTRPLLVALASLALGCSRTWTPEKIDSVAATCHAGIANGTVAARPSQHIALPREAKPATEPVVIYGASWCPACGTAKAYMARRGIPFVYRDVDDDASAATARDATLTTAGLRPTQTLPVIDVRGTVTIGFYPCVVEKVWGGG
jgi:glutaredoxin